MSGDVFGYHLGVVLIQCLFLDGTEGEVFVGTATAFGWRVPPAFLDVSRVVAMRYQSVRPPCIASNAGSCPAS
jgi:hypothetical protein